MQSLSELNKRFGGLFRKPDESDDTDDGQTSGGFKRWGWIITLDNLSGGDPTKWNYYRRLNVIEFLTVVSYFKDKHNEQKRIAERERIKALSQRQDIR